MSKHETMMTRWYWQQRKGTLIEEFPAVRQGLAHGRRLLDGVIILGGDFRLAKSEEITLEGKDIVIVQTKNHRLGMYLMGQTLFSIELMKRFRPRSIESIALCAKDDDVLRALLEKHADCSVVICPAEVCRQCRLPA